MAQYKTPHDEDATHESEYPDPEISQMQNSGWAGQNRLRSIGGMLSFEAGQNDPTFSHSYSPRSDELISHQSTRGSSVVNEAIDEFEASSSRYRSKSREDSENADFLDDVDSG
jgi:hypothetical protein